jgi:glycosyltransferase involved in cell wall biosynthesis
LVTTYPPSECGIGNYSRELRRALARCAPDIDVTVLAERAGAGVEADRGVVRAWDRRTTWLDELPRAIAGGRFDAVHIQHDETHFGQDRRFVALLERIRALDVRTIVTLHSVYDRTIDLPLRVSGKRFHKHVAGACDHIVTHQRTGMADVLVAHGVPPARITVIPHGTPELDLPDRAHARAVLGIPQDAPVALFFGFIHPKKNVHVAVRAFENVSREIPNARLLIAGRTRNTNTLDDGYALMLARMMRRGIDAGRILYTPGYIPTERKPLYFAAADLLLLPHDQRFGAASGVLHEGLAAGRAIMCSRTKKFAEAVDELAHAMPYATPAPRDVVAWEVGMERLLGNIADRERAIELVKRLAEATSWRASAARHAALYRGICYRRQIPITRERPSPGSRAI